MVMLQRLPDEDDEEFKGESPPSADVVAFADGTDPYDSEEPIPASSKAIDSSCWELSAYQKHYLAPVATLGKIFAETFTKQPFNMEDFLDHGYSTVSRTAEWSSRGADKHSSSRRRSTERCGTRRRSRWIWSWTLLRRRRATWCSRPGLSRRSFGRLVMS